MVVHAINIISKIEWLCTFIDCLYFTRSADGTHNSPFISFVCIVVNFLFD